MPPALRCLKKTELPTRSFRDPSEANSYLGEMRRLARFFGLSRHVRLLWFLAAFEALSLLAHVLAGVH